MQTFEKLEHDVIKEIFIHVCLFARGKLGEHKNRFINWHKSRNFVMFEQIYCITEFQIQLKLITRVSEHEWTNGWCCSTHFEAEHHKFTIPVQNFPEINFNCTIFPRWGEFLRKTEISSVLHKKDLWWNEIAPLVVKCYAKKVISYLWQCFNILLVFFGVYVRHTVVHSG